MTSIEEKKIIIRLPRLYWRSFWNLRTGIVLSLTVCAAAFFYWSAKIRPFYWIHSARVESFSSVVSCDSTGRLTESNLEEGDFVKKGKILFSLDTDALLASQKELQKTTDFLNEEIRQEKKRMEKAMNDYLSLSHQQEMGMECGDAIAKNLEQLEAGQTKSEEMISQWEKAQKDLSFYESEIKKMSFPAPFDGVVLKKIKDAGSVVAYGEPIYILSDPSRTWIEAEIPEKELGRISIGTPARIQLVAYPQKKFEGKVCWIGPATVSKSSLLPSKQNETIAIKISLEKGDIPLKPGLSAEVGLKIY